MADPFDGWDDVIIDHRRGCISYAIRLLIIVGALLVILLLGFAA